MRAATETDTQQRLALDLFDRWREAARRLRAEEEVVARAETNLIRMRSLYVAGAIALLDLLDARRTLDDARERCTDARAASRQSRVEAENRP